MKKFTSIFLVISMIMWNINSGVVEALSTCGNEVKSLVNTLTKSKEEKTVDVKEGKGLDKEITQIPSNNNVDNTKVVDSKTKDQQVGKSLDKKTYDSNNEGNVKKHVVLIYSIETGNYYHYIDKDHATELYSLNKKITKNKGKIKLNNLLTRENFAEVEDDDPILDAQEVTLVVTGSGSYEGIEFDNEGCEIPFNILFYKMQGTHCSFTFENIKSIRVIGENTIFNSSEDNTALTYSFNSDYSKNPLKIDEGSSFIVYNEDNVISDNIFYSGDDVGESGEDSEDSGDNSENSENSSRDTGYSSVVNISFEESKSQGNKFILEPINSNGISKQFSGKKGYNTLSILLVSDNNNYILKEDNNQTPYYYRTSNSTDDNGNNKKIGQIRSKIVLSKNNKQDCYKINNKRRVEMISTKYDEQSYYLDNTLKDIMNSCANIDADNFQFIFLGDYEINTDDINAIKSYDLDTTKITFKTKVDDYIYLLNINEDIELMGNNGHKYSVIFDDIKFKYNSNNRYIYANGSELKFGYNVKMEGLYYPSISVGSESLKNFTSSNSTSLTINSGIYGFVKGDCFDTLQNIDVTINGGIFNNDVIVVDGNVLNNATFTISNNPTFKSKVLVISSKGNVKGSLKVTINGGIFNDEIIVVYGKVGRDTTLTISNNNNPTFKSRVIGAYNGSYIGSSLNISVKGGTFREQVIGVLSNDTTGKFTLSGLINRYLFSKNNKTQKDSSENNGVKTINISIEGGTFKGNIIGSNIRDSIVTMTVSKGKFQDSLIGNTEYNSTQENAIININDNVTIPYISNFSKLVVGKSKKGISLKVNKLDKGSSTGNLCLYKQSKIYITSSQKSKLNNIELYGDNNTLVLPKDINLNASEDTALIELYGAFINNGKRLKVQLTKSTTSEIYLIKFIQKSNVDVRDKYELQEGYYVRDNKGDGCVVLCPQTIFDLEYNLQDDRLWMIDDKGNKSEAWWYSKDNNSKDVSLDSNELYQYKGYDLITKNKDRNLILTGRSSDKNIIVNNVLNNFNVELNTINLNNSNIKLNKLESLKINGENTINNVNDSTNINDVFTYTFNGNQTSDNVLFVNQTSYLNIFTKEGVNPFNGIKENGIDFKFNKPFNEEIDKVRLKNINNNIVYKFKIPNDTQRLGILVDGSNDTAYKLYHGEEGDTGNSVYVAGNTQDRFTDEFKTSKEYLYVRRAKPVNQINVDMPSQIYFTIDVDGDKLNSPNEINWDNHFHVTEMRVKNNSLVVQDQFTDESGQTHNFVGKGSNNNNLELGYMGVSSSEDMTNCIKLVSKDELDPCVETDNTLGLKLALKLGDTEIDESIGVSDTPLKIWNIPYDKQEIIPINPNFKENGNFFNINKNTINTFKLNSSHKFTFRFGLK